MQCLFRYSAVLAIISIVVAQPFDPITSPSQDQNLVAGSSVDIAWTYSSVYSGALTISLVLGPTTTNLSLGIIIAAGLDNAVGSYPWVIPSDLPSFAVYAFNFSLDSDPPIFEYTPIHITGLSSSETTSSTAISLPSVTTPPPSTSSSTSTQPNTSNSSSPPISSPSSTVPIQTFSSTTSSSTGGSSSSTLLPTSHGLSAGAKAGIGAGVALGVLLMACIAGIAFWYGMRFKARKDKRDNAGDVFVEDLNKFSKAELYPGRPQEAELRDEEPLNTKYRREG